MGSKNKRNFNAALASEAAVGAWVESQGIMLRVSLDGSHWRFHCKRRIIEWWPHTGRLIKDKKHATHEAADSWEEVCGIVAEEFGLDDIDSDGSYTEADYLADCD